MTAVYPGTLTPVNVTVAATGSVRWTTTSVPAGVLGSGSGTTVQARLAGVVSTLPALSVAKTSKLYSPGARSEISSGELQPANGSPLNEHWKSASSSSAVKKNVAVLLGVVPVGPPSIVVSGARRSSMTHSKNAGGSSTRRRWLVALTSNRCSPASSSL